MRAVRHVRLETIGVPRRRRVARVERGAQEAVWIAPIEAWLAAYRMAKSSTPLTADEATEHQRIAAAS